MKTLFPLLFVILSLVGIADASYLTYEKYSGNIPPCGAGFDCGKVLSSPYSQLAGVPLSGFGLLYYACIFLFAVVLVSEIKLEKIPLFKHPFFKKATALDFLIIITSFGLLFSGYLVFLMGVIIGAWCKYCLVSTATSLLLFIFVQVYTHFLSNEPHYFLKRNLFTVLGWLYQHLLKKAFFLLDPEVIHDCMIQTGAVLGKLALTRWKVRLLFSFQDSSLQKTLVGMTFSNPVGLAAGFDYNGDLSQIAPSVGFGWHTIGTVTLGSYAGNQPPRLGRFPRSRALLVNKGLKTIGAAALIKKLSTKQVHIPTGISIASTNKAFKNTREQIQDIVSCFKAFENSSLKHSYYELNISCPNTFGGEPFTTPERLAQLLTALATLRIKRPMFVKMPIDQSESETLQLLKVVAKFNIQGVIFGNLTKDKKNPAVDPKDRAEWAKRKGNLSGKPTFERSNKLIKLTKQNFKDRFVIVGTGGIFSPADAEKKLDLGADLVQLITGMIFQGPQLIGQINEALAEKQAKTNSN